jgi:hypothetical protein
MNLGIALVIIGLLIWLLGGIFWLGVILIVLGLLWMFAPPMSGYPRRRPWW